MSKQFKNGALGNCEARQVSDQMSCHRCGLVWDVSDIDPPECGKLAANKAAPPRVDGRKLVTGQSHGSQLKATRERWAGKDRSVGRSHLDQLKGNFKD